MAERNGSSLKRYHIAFAIACFLMLAGTVAVFIQDHCREFRQYQEAYRQAELRVSGDTIPISRTAGNRVMSPDAGVESISPRQGIQQVVLKNLPVDMHFDKTPRVDRCMTCHQAIDQADPRYEASGDRQPISKQPEIGVSPRWPEPQRVLRSHPRLDLFVAPNSKHPYGSFGCTICHLGCPMGVSFNRAAHSPQHPRQAEEWRRKYGWAPSEFWEQKMLPLQYTEASCLKCHRGLDEIPEAPRLNAGRELFRNRGCTNCHMDQRGQTANFQTAGNFFTCQSPLADLAWVGRTGPDLRRLGEKLNLQWCIGWTLNPSDFRPSTRMPRFLGLENRKDDNGEPLKLQLSAGAVDREAVETEALCAYLFVASRLREKTLPEPTAGDAEAGRKLFSAVGCVACHSTRDRFGADRFVLSDFAPDLSRIGDKVSSRWLFAWLKEPAAFWAETKMPNLRLSDTDAAALVAYLAQTMRSGVQPVFYQAFPEEAFDALIIEKFSPMIPRERLARLLRDTTGLLEFPAAGVARASRLPTERFGLSALAAKVKYAARPDGTLKDSGTGEWTEAQIAKIKKILSAEPDKARAAKAFFAGEFLIQHHGCYACHNTQGWTYSPLPCPNLQGEADKDLAKFAFGKTLADGSVPNTKWDWIRTKIARPRIYDLGSLRSIKPFERLRMPWFNLTPEQIDGLVTHVLSLTLAGCASSPASLPAEMQHEPRSREITLDRGHRVFRELNCTGCHLAGLSREPLSGPTDASAQVPLESLVALLAPGALKAMDSGIYVGEDLVSLNYAPRQAPGPKSELAPLKGMLNIKRGTCLTNTTASILLAEMPVRADPHEPAWPAGFRLVEGPPKPAGENWVPFGELVKFKHFQRLTVPLFYSGAVGAARAYAYLKEWWAEQDGYERLAGTAALVEAGQLTLQQAEERKQARRFFEPAAIKVRFTKGEGAIVPHIVKLEAERRVPNAGPQQAPPSLVFEGCRVQPDWLYQYLRNVHTLRWGFTIRMPSFWGAAGSKAIYPSGRLSALKDPSPRGAGLDVEPLPTPPHPTLSPGGRGKGEGDDALPDDVAQVVEFFTCDAEEKPFGYQPLPLDGAEGKKLYEQGRLIVTGSEIGCTNCHALGERNPPEPKWAFNLANVKRRLKEPWLNRFLTNPQSIYPWTNMPNNFKIDWEGSYSFNPFDPLRGLMDGDGAKAQESAEKIRAVKYYLLHLGEGEIGK